MIRAEWIKLLSVRGWVIALAAAALAIAGLGLAAAAGTHTVCPGGPCPKPPTGPGGEAVDDHFTYVHQPLAGDGSLTAHIASFTGIITYPPPNHDAIVPGLVPWAKAGIMIKDGTRPGASYAAVLLTGDHGVRLQHDFMHDRAGPSGASWLRLSRSGDTIRAYASDDGTAWTPVGAVDLPGLPHDVRIGVFATSPSDVTSKPGTHGGSIVQARFTQATAVFDHLDRTGDWKSEKVGADDLLTDWERFHQDSVGTVAAGRITVSGSGDIAPGGRDAGVPVEHTLAGIIAALLVVMVVAVLSVTSEYRLGLIRTTLAATPARGRVVLAKAAVIGAVTFGVALPAIAVTVPIAGHLLRGNGNFVLPTPFGTQLRLIVGTAALVSLAALLAYGLGAVFRRGVPAVAAAVGLVVLPYLLSTASVLPVDAARWLLRVTPAAGFAIQQTLPAYHQVVRPYLPAGGYFPLPPWAGLAVLAGWVAALLAAATLRIRRGDA